MHAGFAEVTLEQNVVAPISLPGNVEYVSEKRNCPNEDADCNIDDHADQCDIRNTTNPCGDWNYEREKTGKDVAKAGN
jgi:hypothetical protein